MATRKSGHHSRVPGQLPLGHHCHGNGQHQPSYLPRPPGLLQTLQTQPIPARPGTSIVWQGIQAYRTSNLRYDLHFVRSTITTARGWWRVNKVSRRRNVDEARSGPSTGAWPRLVRSARLPGVPGCRGYGVTGDALELLRASLVDPAAETANNHMHQHLRIQKVMGWTGIQQQFLRACV